MTMSAPSVPELEVREAQAQDRPEVARLLDACLRELGAPSAYPWLDAYWSESGRFPYLLSCDGDVAGFALVRRLPGRFDFEMAEFYVVPQWRRRGVGRMAVNRLLHLHPGRWCFRVSRTNGATVDFWSKVLPAIGQPQGDGVQFEVRWPPESRTLSPRQRRLVQSWYAGGILLAASWWLAGYSLAGAKLFLLVVGWPVAVLYGLSLGQPVSTSAVWTEGNPAYFDHLVLHHPWLRPWAILCALASISLCAAALTRKIDVLQLLGNRGLIAAVSLAIAPVIVATQIDQFHDYADMDDIL